MLLRAIRHLLSNALRVTPSGARIFVTCSVVRASPDAEPVHLAVENTGEPIPSEHLSRLFDRFYRVDASRRNSGDGAGLGLAITRSILRSHGGDIEGRTGEGSNIFEMWIPAVPASHPGDSPIVLSRTHSVP